MKLAHPELKMIIEDKENIINVLVIENEKFFCRTVEDIYAQINGYDGDYVISRNNEPIQWSRNSEIITQYVPFDINRKSLITKLYNKLKKEALGNYNAETCEISGRISEYVSMLSNSVDAELCFDESTDAAGIFKLVNLKFEESGNSIAEKMISYMQNVRELEGEKWFIAVGLKNYLDKNELIELYHTVFLKKIKLLLIEGNDKENLEGEKKYIIDKELCEIY